MIDQAWGLQRSAGAFLVCGFIAMLVGVLMFAGRGGVRRAPIPSQAYFVWERSFIMAAVVLTAIGLVLLEGRLADSSGQVLARVGATAYLFGGMLGVTAEALGLSQREQSLYALIVIYVVLAFLALAAIGGALLQAKLLPVWIGWLTIAWSLGWLIVLPLVTPRDIYFPVLHHMMPLLIGLALLLSAAPAA
jgi:hypothetical protein